MSCNLNKYFTYYIVCRRKYKYFWKEGESVGIPEGNIDGNQENKDIKEIRFCKKHNKLFKCAEEACCNDCDKWCYDGCPMVKLFYEYVAITNKISDLNIEIAMLTSRQTDIVDKVDCCVYKKCNQNI